MSAFYICDMRRSWRGQWAVTFWRPNDAGYAYPLTWAGRYALEAVDTGGDYYHQREGRSLIRFAVPCEVADRLSAPPPKGVIDGDAGPVVFNNPKNRRALRRAAFIPSRLPSPPTPIGVVSSLFVGGGDASL